MADRAGKRARRRRRGHLFLRGATWWGRVRIAGSERSGSLRTGDRAEAVRRLEQWVAAEERAAVVGARHSWPEAVVRWEREILPGLKPGTGHRYRTSIRQLDPYLKRLTVDQITKPVLAEIVAKRRRRRGINGGTGERKPGQNTNATLNRDLTALGSVLDGCVSWGWIASNPAATFDRKRLTRERRDPIQIPSAVDVAAAIARAPNGASDLLAFLAETGMRKEEAAALEWSDLSPDRRTVTLVKTKTSRPRALVLREEAYAIVKRRVRHLKSPFVFWHDEGQRYATNTGQFRVMIAGMVKAAAGDFRRFRIHDLRHKFAVDRLVEGWDIYTLSRYLGHTTVKTTEMYLGYVPGGSAVGRQGAGAPIAPPSPALKGTNRGTGRAGGTGKKAKSAATSKR